MLKRRDLLKAVGGLAISTGLVTPWHAWGQQVSPQPLSIPPLLRGEAVNGVNRYRLRVQRGTSRFLPGLTTPTFGINGDFLGPTLHLRRGEQVQLQVTNNLGAPTTMHWHGMHLPVVADGGPHQEIADGGVWEPAFTVLQPGATCWYHSHLLNRTGEQVYQGLAGMIIIEDEDTHRDGIPSTYGVDDIPLVIQDRAFNVDGSFRYVGMHMDVMTGMFGDTILVNGTLSPEFAPTTSRVRFRLLNGSNARTYTLAFDDARPFTMIASDGGLLAAPLALTSLELAPAERAEIVVDFSDGRPVNLVSLPMAADSPSQPRGMMGNMHPMNNNAFHLLSLRPAAALQRSPALPVQLTQLERIEASEAVVERQLILTMAMGMGMGMGRGRGAAGGMMGAGASFFINGQAMDMGVINQHVLAGDTEIWELVNDSMMMHPFHIHHGQFQLLSRNGRSPAAQEAGFKDTVKVGPGESVRFIMRFQHFSDAQRPYMYHCHILEHEDNGMMGQFIVT